MKSVLIVVHPNREPAAKFAAGLTSEFIAAGFIVKCNHSELIAGTEPAEKLDGLEAVIVLGGDGTILRAAEIIKGLDVPVIGINLGNVGFLAEITQPSSIQIVTAVISGEIIREPRLVIQYEILRNDKSISNGWALNEVAVARTASQMLELFLQIDGRPLSKWGCDGVICATPTGSTAYAFSAGGPVIWPEVDALLLLPLAAHALFSRPMVVSPQCEIVVNVLSGSAEVSADGLRQFELKIGDRIILTRDSQEIALSYINPGNFTDRLVAKFKLPIEGWRGDSS